MTPACESFLQLEPVLQSLIGEHQTLLALIERHHAAIRSADREGIGQSLMDQSEVLQRIAELDRKRMVLANDLRKHFGIHGDPTITDLARYADEPIRSRLLELTSTLRTAIERVRKRNNVIRQASLTLLAHMEGLMNQVNLKLSHARTYSSRGAHGRSPQVISGLDLTQ